MKDQSFWFLENLNIQDLFDEEKLNKRKEVFKNREYEKGTYIYMPDQSSDKIFFLLDGRVRIGSVGENGKEITKAILSKGEVFGELAMIDEGKRRDYAIALEKTTVRTMTVEDMRSLMKDHNNISIFFMRIMGSRVLEMEHRLESLIFKDSKSRIIEYLVELIEKHGQRVGYEWVVRKFVTHQDIANFTATSRQTVTTVLNELRDENIILFNRRRLLVRSLDQLKSKIQ